MKMRTINRKSILISVILSFVSILLLRNAYCFTLNKRLILIMGMVCLLWILLAFFSVSFNNFIDNSYHKITAIIHTILNNKKRFFFELLSLGCVVCISKVTEMIISVTTGTKSSYILFSAVLAVILTIYIIYRFRHSLYEKMHQLFFVCSMICGVFYIVCAPTEVVMSWDEHIHFNNAMRIVDTVGGYSVLADKELSSQVYETETPFFAETTREQHNIRYDQLYSEKKIGDYESTSIQPVTVAYLPYAAGIILGRGLLLPYHIVFRMAKFMNYLLYSVLISLAIKHSRNHKTIFAGIGMLPTSMFMAASFSYDPWILSFTLLGFSLYQEAIDKRKINGKIALRMGSCFFLGLMIKAVYFPILIPMLFAPDEVFENKKYKKWFRVFVVALMALLVISFALPMLMNPGVQTDVRGGSDVNSAEQVKFILSNPFHYAVIYFRYLFTFYLVPNHLYGFITAFAYLGNGSKSIISALVLFMTVLFSRKNRDATLKNGTITLFSSFFALTLVVTALYVSFTPVGLETVNGCQFRYLIPLLFPVTSCFGCGTKKLSKYAGEYGAFVIFYMSVSMLVFIGNYLCCLY